MLRPTSTACAALCAALGAACAEPVRVAVEVPALPSGYRSLFLVMITPTGASVTALDPASIAARDLPVFDEAPEALSVYALAYEDALDSFPLAGPGPVALAEGDPSFALPGVGRFEVAEVRGAEVTGWSPLTALPPALSKLRLPGFRSLCRSFRHHVISGPSEIESAVGIDDRNVLLVTRTGPFLWASADDDYRTVDVPVPADVPRLRAHRDALGGVWLFGDGGATARFDPETRTVEVLPRMPNAEEIAYLDDGEDDAAGQFWVLGTRAGFDAFAGGAWLSHRHDAYFERRDYARGIAEAAGSVVTTSHESNTVQVYGPDGARREATAPSRVGFGAAITVPGFGAILGDNDGGLHRFIPPSSFELLPGSGAPGSHRLAVYTMARLGRTVFLGSPIGAVGQYHLDQGFCPTITVTRTSVEEIAPVGTRDLVVVDDAADTVTWLEGE